MSTTPGKSFRRKIFLSQLTLLILVAGCVYFYRVGLTDYIVLLCLVMFTGSFFFLADTTVNQNHVIIRKNYCWALIPITWTITYEQIYDIKSNVREAVSDSDTGIEHESLFASIIFSIFTHTTNWENYILKYERNGKLRHIELKLNRDQYLDIWRRMKDRKPISWNNITPY